MVAWGRLLPFVLGLALPAMTTHLSGEAAAPLPVQAYRAPTLTPSRKAEGAVLSVGRAKLAFSGTYAILACGGREVGLFLDGGGTLEYASTFHAELPVFGRNLQTWSKLDLKDGKVAIPFKRARIYLVGQALPAWAGEAGEPLDRVWTEFQTSFQGMDFGASQALAFQDANARGATYAMVLLEQEGIRWAYEYDGYEGREEGLYWIETQRLPQTPEGYRLQAWQLSRQPLGWDPKKDLAPIFAQIQDLDVDLRTPDNREAQVVAQETLFAGVTGMTRLQFQLLGEEVTEKDVRHLKVTRVEDEAGRELAFDQFDQGLSVALAVPTQAGKAFRLKFFYHGDFLVRPHENNYWELPVGGRWYPMLKGQASSHFTFHGTVRTQGDWISFLSGETVRRGQDGEWNLVETRTTKPISWPAILAGTYFFDEETRDGVTIRIATYSFKPGVTKAVLKDQAFGAIRYYQPFLGPFPFKEFSIVQKHGWGYGQAPAGMMFITQDAFNQTMNHQMLERAFASSYAQEKNTGRPMPSIIGKTMDVRLVFAHEVAHQYWGTVVKAPSPEDQWLEEAFADYCASLFVRDTKGKSYFDSYLKGYFGRGRLAAFYGPVPLANQIRLRDNEEASLNRKWLLYDKGAALLASLHGELGEETFLTWLKSIQSNFRWKFATTRRTFDLLNFITKKDFHPFMDQYFWGLQMPPEK